MVRDEILSEYAKVLDTNQFVGGPMVGRIEAEIASYCDTKYAVALSSGTDALLVALMALDLKPGDEVITTPFTFFATVGSIARAGAVPVFADIDPVTFNIDSDEIIKKITDRTKCILPVHLYGQAADMDAINKIAKERGIIVIEDAAQAIGAAVNGDKAGGVSDIGCFSFFPTKNLGGFGEGGMAVCGDESLYNKMMMLRNHGSSKRYYHEYIGGNFRMDALQAAALGVKLKRLDSYIRMRRDNAHQYFEQLQGVMPESLPKEINGRLHTYNQFVIKVDKRDELKEFLAQSGIGTQIYYPLCLHEQSCFKYLGCARGDFPKAEEVSGRCLALPIYPELTEDEITYVSDKIKEFYRL